MFDIRLPNIDGQTETEQLAQIRSYLYQFAEQLNLAFNGLEDDDKSANITYGSQAVSQSASAIEKTQADNTFSQVKGLIIKSADVIEALTEEISKTLKGKYVAQSEFGTFKETTEAHYSATDKALEIKFSNNQDIDADSNNVEYTKLKTTDAWVKIGLIDYDVNSNPSYGVEIGQIIEDKDESGNPIDKEVACARYTAEGIQLFDKLEDAYGNQIPSVEINGEYMSIKRMKVGKTIHLGGYRIDVERNNGIVFKWEGVL